MLRLLQLLIFGHAHKWETIRDNRLRDQPSGAQGTRYTLRCQHCGNIKFKDVI